MHSQGVTNLPLFEHCFDFCSARMVGPHETIHELDTFFGAIIHQLLSFLCSGGEGLFANHMFAMVCGFFSPFRMKVVGQGIVNDIDVGVF